MIFPEIAWMPVVISTVVYMMLGALWYSPFLFGKWWMKLKHVTEKDLTGMNTAMVSSLVGSVAVAIVLSFLVEWVGVRTFGNGAILGFLVYILVAQVGWNQVVYSKESEFDTRKNLFFIDYSYPLVAYIIMGGIIAVM